MGADSVHLPHLETFSKAAELGSFTAAAKVLGLTQAAVSQRIQFLERVLNKSLFDRRGGRATVTPAGRTLYDYSQRIDALLRDARRTISGYEPPLTGELDIAASSVPGEHLLPNLLAEFGRKYPHFRVRASVTDSQIVTGQVERGEVSLGLVGRKLDVPHLEFRYLASDRMVLVAPPDHPLARKKAVTLNQLARVPLIVREAGSGLRHCFEKEMDRNRRALSELRVVLELGSNEAIREAVQRGVGVAILSVYAVHKELEAGRLVALPLKEIRCDREMYLVQDRRRVLPLPARLFLNHIEANPVPAQAS